MQKSVDTRKSGFILFANVKEHATLSAGASVDYGVEVQNTGEHVNREADRGCCVSSCSAGFLLSITEDGTISASLADLHCFL